MSTPEIETATATLIRRLDAADRLPGAAELRDHSYDLLRLRPGDPVADIGCGAGRAVAELAARETRPLGVDPSTRMLDVARTRWPALDFRLGTAESLPLPAASITGYRADKVFHEIADPAAALAEARRVLKPGGRLVLLGQDWDAIIIDSDDPETTRAIVHGRADAVTNPRAARAYRTLLLDNGFDDITVEVRTPVLTDADTLPMLTGLTATASHLDVETVDRWIAEQTTRAHSGRLCVVVPLFIAAASAR
ncbi:methyltransferase domain-containing protein [Nocardia sp. NPDC050710]|uniref:methyltransferase domain-containing protein n=1 Tax=Nocardia sp. NPDC050710 TaxID=3157220 RepID=UPI0033D54349